MTQAPNFSRLFVLGAVGASLVLMVCISLSQMVFHPLVSSESRSRGLSSSDTGQTPEEGAMPEFAMSEQLAGEVTELMAKLKDNPNDGETLTALGDTFLRARDWNRAEVFLVRAGLSRPSDVRPRYLLGIAQYQQGKLTEAVATFEELLQIKDDPTTLYNLAIIYKYQLNNPGRAEELLKKAVESPDADADVKEKARKELE